jgi:N-acetylmuramoyl-L-alanine amidase
MLNELLEQDFPAAISEGDGLFRVRVGQYANLDDASEMEQRLRRAGYQTVIVRE